MCECEAAFCGCFCLHAHLCLRLTLAPLRPSVSQCSVPPSGCPVLASPFMLESAKVRQHPNFSLSGFRAHTKVILLGVSRETELLNCIFCFSTESRSMVFHLSSIGLSGLSLLVLCWFSMFQCRTFLHRERH